MEKPIIISDVEESSQNLTAKQISKTYEFLRQAIRNHLSRNLIDTNENYPLKCRIILSSFYPEPSPLDAPVVEAMYQDNEGRIWVKLDDYDDYVDVDDIPVPAQVDIVNAIPGMCQ